MRCETSAWLDLLYSHTEKTATQYNVETKFLLSAIQLLSFPCIQWKWLCKRKMKLKACGLSNQNSLISGIVMAASAQVKSSTTTKTWVHTCMAKFIRYWSNILEKSFSKYSKKKGVGRHGIHINTLFMCFLYHLSNTNIRIWGWGCPNVLLLRRN